LTISPALRNLIKYALFLGIGVGLLWFAYRNVKLEKIMDSLSHANWLLIVLALILNYSATVIRGLRWNTLLQPLGYRADPWTCVHSVAFGYLMNDLVPRSGELARCTLLNRAEKIPVDKLFGTVLLERIVDIIMLLIAMMTAVFFNADALSVLMANADASKGKTLLIILAIGIIGLIGTIFFLRKFSNIPFVAKVNKFFSGVLNGIKSILLLKKKLQFVLLTFAIWLTWLFMTQTMMLSLPETAGLDLADSLFLMVAASLGMIIPTQGGIGAYHYTTMLGFVALGYANADNPSISELGLTFAAISWTGKTVLELIMGAVGFFVVTFFKMKKIPQ
jgi:glycosyltransferase 2 family protein